MAVAGLYRRALPSPPAIEFASPEGKRLFTEALADGTMEGFFKLISYYQTQSEPAYCGLATLAVVLNALAIDPGRKWKGPWRWFDDSMLDCCEPLATIEAEGITFGKVACLAHCNGARVEAFRTSESTVDDFRRCVISCTSSEDCHVITSYHRAVFKQTGTGHFSPIGGYHTGKDMVLILDVARYKYPPHWVPLTLLWEGMDVVDKATGHHRGYMIISKLRQAPSILYTVILMSLLQCCFLLARPLPSHLQPQSPRLQLQTPEPQPLSPRLQLQTPPVPYPLLSVPLQPHWQIPRSLLQCRLLQARPLPSHPLPPNLPPPLATPPLPPLFPQHSCRNFMRRGICRKYNFCKYNHPRAEMEFDPYPQRSARNCKYFLEYRFCLLGHECRFNHPRDLERLSLDGTTFNDDGLPLYPGRPECSRGKKCRYSAYCWKHHP